MDEPVTVRPASLDDADFLRTLRNDPTVVAASRSRRAVNPCEHADWISAALAASERQLFVICVAGAPVGQARLDAGVDGDWVSIALVEASRGMKVGGRVVRILQRRSHRDLFAEVRSANTASLALFDRAGFRRDDDRGDFVRLRWRNPRVGVNKSRVSESTAVARRAD